MEERKMTFGDAFKKSRFEAKNLHISPELLDYVFGVPTAEELVKAYKKRMGDATKLYRRPHPKNVLVNGDYTTVVWKDGSATVVKREKDEPYDFDKAILYAIIKHSYTTSSSDLCKYLGEFTNCKTVKTPPTSKSTTKKEKGKKKSEP